MTLLLIGDTAHVMSLIEGNGINYAVQDAAAAFNLLAEPLAAGHVTKRDLAPTEGKGAAGAGRASRIIQATALVGRRLPPR